NDPANWVDGTASPELHAIAILFARDIPERERCRAEHGQFLAQCPGVEVISSLDLEATPPFEYAHDHFGYRDRLSLPAIEGLGGDVPTPGSGHPLKPGEFFLGYPDENGPTNGLPKPEILSRNGSFVAYRRLIRPGGPSGPACPAGARDDGVHRGIASFARCASLPRSSESAPHV